MKTNHQQPTDSELEVLSLLWKKGPSTVRTVNEFLNKKRRVGYTTTLKIMQIMHEKGFVGREEKGKSHIYFTKIEENTIQKRLITKIVDSAFGGSASRLVMQALGNHKASEQEREEIRNLLDKLDKSDLDE